MPFCGSLPFVESKLDFFNIDQLSQFLFQLPVSDLHHKFQQINSTLLSIFQWATLLFIICRYNVTILPLYSQFKSMIQSMFIPAPLAAFSFLSWLSLPQSWWYFALVGSHTQCVLLFLLIAEWLKRPFVHITTSSVREWMKWNDIGLRRVYASALVVMQSIPHSYTASRSHRKHPRLHSIQAFCLDCSFLQTCSTVLAYHSFTTDSPYFWQCPVD